MTLQLQPNSSELVELSTGSDEDYWLKACAFCIFDECQRPFDKLTAMYDDEFIGRGCVMAACRKFGLKPTKDVDRRIVVTKGGGLRVK